MTDRTSYHAVVHEAAQAYVDFMRGQAESMDAAARSAVAASGGDPAREPVKVAEALEDITTTALDLALEQKLPVLHARHEVIRVVTDVVSRLSALADKAAGGTTTLSSRLEIPWRAADQTVWSVFADWARRNPSPVEAARENAQRLDVFSPFFSTGSAEDLREGAARVRESLSSSQRPRSHRSRGSSTTPGTAPSSTGSSSAQPQRPCRSATEPGPRPDRTPDQHDRLPEGHGYDSRA